MPRQCRGLRHGIERKLLACIARLAPFIPPQTAIVDVGANDGSGTAQLACIFPQNTVIGVEPTNVNVLAAHNKTRRWPNAFVMRGILWSERVSMGYNMGHEWKAGVYSQVGRSSLVRASPHTRNLVPTYTLDSLLSPDDETKGVNGKRWRLGLAHIDTESTEEDVLIGAASQIQANRPLLTVETYPESGGAQPMRDSHLLHKRLVSALHRLNYTCVFIDEVCGNPKDCRNMVCAPSERQDTTNALMACDVERARGAGGVA